MIVAQGWHAKFPTSFGFDVRQTEILRGLNIRWILMQSHAWRQSRMIIHLTEYYRQSYIY
jgi:hypothetical protein